MRVFLQHSGLAMAYERSRAARPLEAASPFLRDLWSSLRRIKRIGLRAHLDLAHLELKCAGAGFIYPRADDLAGPPWQLAEQFIAMPVEALPVHPLIDPIMLQSLLPEQTSAATALVQLLSPDGLNTRWSGVPLIGEDLPSIPGEARVAVCLHLFYPDMWPLLRDALEAIPEPWDLYVSVPDFACTPMLARIAQEHPSARFMPCPNRGRDVLPFLRWLGIGVFDRYDAVCKLHTKRSPHMPDGERWLRQVLQSLLGNPKSIAGLLDRMRRTPETGLIGPHEVLINSSHRTHQGSNRMLLAQLAKRASLPQAALDSPFFAGTMFWFRPSAMALLGKTQLEDTYFPCEMAQTDGTPAHAIERLIWPLVEQAGYKVESILSDRLAGEVPPILGQVTKQDMVFP